MKAMRGLPGALAGAATRGEQLLFGAPAGKVPRKVNGPRMGATPPDELTTAFAGALAQMLQAQPVAARTASRATESTPKAEAITLQTAAPRMVKPDAAHTLLDADEKDRAPESAPLFVPGQSNSAPAQQVGEPQRAQPADFQAAARDAALRADAATTVHVGPHHARIVLGHAGEAGNVEVRVKVNAGQLHVEARGDAAPMLLARSSELAAVAASHGLQLGGFSMGQPTTGGGTYSGADARAGNGGASQSRSTTTSRTRDGARPSPAPNTSRRYA